MHLGIDMGTSYTKIAALADGEWLDITSEHSLIPTAAAYSPAAGQLYFGNLALRLDEPGIDKACFFKLDLKRCAQYRLGPYKLAELTEEFLSFLWNTYIKEEITDITSLSLSVPNYFGLNSRRILLDAARKISGLTDIHLIPEPLAALMAYNTLNPSGPLEGAVLSIDMGGGTTDFSFMEAAGHMRELILETQLQIGYDAFSGSELDLGIIRNIFLPLYQIQTGYSIPDSFVTGTSLLPSEKQLYYQWLTEAEQLKLEVSCQGFSALYLSDFYKGASITSYIDQDSFLDRLEPVYERLWLYCQGTLRDRAVSLGLASADRWQLDCILLQGGASLSPGVEQIIKRCFPDIPLIQSQQMNLVARGLCCWNAYYLDRNTRLKTVYPFDFYQEVPDPEQKQSLLAKIPFDTANLELEVRGRYQILSLDTASILREEQDKELALKIYEVAQGEEDITRERFQGMEPVLNLTWQEEQIPDQISVFLNMSLSSLETSEGYSLMAPEDGFAAFPDFVSRQIDALNLIKDYKYIHPDLIKDFAHHLQEQARRSSPGDGHAQTLFYKLICLLQILDSR